MVEKVINSDLKRDCYKDQMQNEANSFLGSNPFLDVDFVRQKLQQFQVSILRDVEQRMSCMIDEVMHEMRQNELLTHEFRHFAKNTQSQHVNTWSNRVKSECLEKNPPQKQASETDAGVDVSDKASSETKTRVLSEGLLTNLSKNVTPKTVPKTKRKRTLPDKVFITRQSYLTALLEVDHMKTIYHIFYIILIVFFMNSVCHDYFVDGRVNFGLGTFKTGFAGIHYVFGIWLLEQVFVIANFYTFRAWAIVRVKLITQLSAQRFWNHSCLILYITSQVVLGYIVTVMSLKLNLPFVSAAVLLIETFRLLMKMHAFVRTNVPRVLAGKLKTHHKEVECSQVPILPNLPSFSSFIYFLFAPTLIYRDSYPRTARIRWRFAIARFLEVVAIAFLFSYIHERHIKVHFADFGKEPLNVSILILKLFGMLMPGVIILLCGFYLLLHSWMNFAAEILRFGDRMFYKDWWTSSSYEGYYRNWNVVIHDWLYEYIYKDFFNHIFKGNKTASSLVVFMISALVHEYVLAYSLQLFFPVIFVLFGIIGVFMVFVTRHLPSNFGNSFLWFSLIYGNALMVSLYSAEYFARFNCPKEYKNWSDYFIPAIWSCYNK